MRSLHPFPARMAPDLAINQLDALPKGFLVLDPMSGSGTVVRHASELGLRSKGFDLDPLAVLISSVSSRTTDDASLETAAEQIIKRASGINAVPELPWIDGDPEAERFITYWFGEAQRADLRKLSHLLMQVEEFEIDNSTADALRLAFSRIIVTKGQAASLAQDTSHSRPHRVATESDYNVLDGFAKSVSQLRKRLAKLSPKVEGVVECGDARKLSTVADDSVDYVLTSPPYLNAIDYMRGHRMSLIWLGHSYAELSRTRSNSIGAERAADVKLGAKELTAARDAMGSVAELPNRYQNMIERYLGDLKQMLSEIYRVLRPDCKATFVMGDSCLKGVFLSNTDGLAHTAERVGLSEVDRWHRNLPAQHRYLPTPKNGALSKRMRKENIITFQKPS